MTLGRANSPRCCSAIRIGIGSSAEAQKTGQKGKVVKGNVEKLD